MADTIEIFQFVAIALTSLSMGVHFGTRLTEAPLREPRSGALFTEVQQGSLTTRFWETPLPREARLALLQRTFVAPGNKPP